jgi:hypothetical protein
LLPLLSQAWLERLGALVCLVTCSGQLHVPIILMMTVVSWDIVHLVSNASLSLYHIPGIWFGTYQHGIKERLTEWRSGKLKRLSPIEVKGSNPGWTRVIERATIFNRFSRGSSCFLHLHYKLPNIDIWLSFQYFKKGYENVFLSSSYK